MANFYLAFDQGLDLVPCINKVDLPTADVEGCVQQMVDAFDVNPGGLLARWWSRGTVLRAVDGSRHAALVRRHDSAV